MNSVTENKYAQLSLASITLTVAFTAVHHIYRLGYGFLIPSALLLFLPYLLMRWFRQSGNKAGLWAYGVLNGLIIVWFGLIDGFLDHVLKALSFQNLTFLPGGEAEVVPTALSLWSAEAGNFFYEGTGVLTFFAAVFAVYYGYKFIGGVNTSSSGAFSIRAISSPSRSVDRP
jgi:hypothetical protein